MQAHPLLRNILEKIQNHHKTVEIKDFSRTSKIQNAHKTVEIKDFSRTSKNTESS